MFKNYKKSFYNLEFNLKKDYAISLALVSQLIVLSFTLILKYFINNKTHFEIISLVSICCCGVFFLFALPYIFKSKMYFFVYTYLISLSFYFAQFLIFPQNEKYLIDIFFTLFCRSIPCFIYIVCLDDYSIFIKMLKKSAYIIFILMTFLFIFNYLLDLGDYSMSLGYHLLFVMLTLLMCLNKSKHKLLDLIIVIVSFIELLIFGSRGPVIPMAIFTIFMIIRLITKIKRTELKILLISILTASSILGVIFFKDILQLFVNLLNLLNIQSRSLRLFLNDLKYVSHRDELFVFINESIKKNWLFGTGITSDRLITGVTYAHNIVLELFVDFGVIFGTMLIIIFIYFLFKAIIKNKDKLVFIFFLLCVGLVPLFVSGSYLEQMWFWILLGVIFKLNKKGDKKVVKGSKEKVNH